MVLGFTRTAQVPINRALMVLNGIEQAVVRV